MATSSTRPGLFRDLSLIVLAAGLVFFTNLGGPQLWDEDEPKNASCGREMLERNDWVVPRFNYELRTDKPVLLYWFMMTSYSLFGVSEFSARLGSALLSVGTVLLTYGIGRALFSPGAGRWGALALACGAMFVVVSRAATPDATLIFFTTLAFGAFVWGNAGNWRSENTHEGEEAAGPVSLAPSCGTALAMYLAMSLAVLAKGPVGMLLPTAVIGLFLMSRGEGLVGGVASAQIAGGIRELLRRFSPAAFVRVVWMLRPLTALGLLAVVALPWYVWVGVRTEGAWLEGFLGNHNVGRFTSSMEGHSGPFFYYAIAVMIGLLPWSVFLPLALWQTGQRVRRNDAWRDGSLFIACWAGLYLVFFTMARTKLPNYVLPAYPALALVCGTFVDRWLAAPERLAKAWLAAAAGGIAFTGIALAIGLPVLAGKVLPGEAVLGAIGAFPLLGAAVFLVFLYRERHQQAAVAFAVSGVLFATALFGFASLRVDRHQNSRRVVAWSREASPGGVELATFRHWQPSLVFYSQQPVGRFAEPEQVRAFFESPRAFLVTRAEHLDAIREVLPADVVEVGRMQWFLHKNDVVVLARSSQIQTAGKPLAERKLLR